MCFGILLWFVLVFVCKIVVFDSYLWFVSVFCVWGGWLFYFVVSWVFLVVFLRLAASAACASPGAGGFFLSVSLGRVALAVGGGLVCVGVLSGPLADAIVVFPLCGRWLGEGFFSLGSFGCRFRSCLWIWRAFDLLLLRSVGERVVSCLAAAFWARVSRWIGSGCWVLVFSFVMALVVGWFVGGVFLCCVFLCWLCSSVFFGFVLGFSVSCLCPWSCSLSLFVFEVFVFVSVFD